MEQLKKLHEALKEGFGVEIEEDVFIASLTLFPAIVVAYSDGVIDNKEKEYIAFLADNYAFHNEDVIEVNKETFSDNLCNLLFSLSNEIPIWQKDYIDATKSFLITDESLKSELLIVIDNIARISDGMSKSEQQKIEWIKSELSI